jgi:hypothetical protein|tara:strand:+ start:193 stop:336 length:144 start_codon:yes stop_codon:yes gene_type:complete
MDKDSERKLLKLLEEIKTFEMANTQLNKKVLLTLKEVSMKLGEKWQV